MPMEMIISETDIMEEGAGMSMATTIPLSLNDLQAHRIV